MNETGNLLHDYMLILSSGTRSLTSSDAINLQTKQLNNRHLGIMMKNSFLEAGFSDFDLSHRSYRSVSNQSQDKFTHVA